jgi:signal transduction histidine kinase
MLRVIAAIGGALAVGGSAILIGDGHAGSWWSGAYAFFALFSVFFAVFGWLVIPQQPHNAVLWTMAASAASFGLYIVGLAAAVLAVDDPSLLLAGSESVVPADIPPSAAWILMFTQPAFLLALFPLLTFGLLLFPDGSLPSARWRWVGVLAGVTIVVGTVSWAWGYRPGNTTRADDSAVLESSFVLLGLAVILSLVALIRRFRRSSGVARQQFKWVVWGASIFVPANVVAVVLGGETEATDNIISVVFVVVGTIFLLSYGIAVGKYRLYDIDLVINKTVMVAALTAIIAALYIAVVVVVGLLAGDGTQYGGQVAATVVVALAFGPVRRRAQQWANRAVYGERATPYEVLARFAHRAAEASDDELLARTPKLIVDGTAAVAATLWVKSNKGFRPAATWPQDTDRAPLPAAEVFEDPDADYSLPVFHDGELLGGLSLVTARGEALSPAAEELLANLASGMGLALRNATLTSRLREQVAALEASRERILAADDEARRALERDLDSGPQQQLVALKVMLGPTRKQAAQGGATKTAEMLEQLEADSGEAIRAVREFSGGVYPPLLEAEGLEAAVMQQTQLSVLPIAVEADGLGRYPREVEAAVYFTILEALQNIAKYAGASAAYVVLQQTNGELAFEVTDDGSGFDPATIVAGSGLANMADRLDTVAGTWSLDSTPGVGTTVRGTVPIGDLVLA